MNENTWSETKIASKLTCEQCLFFFYDEVKNVKILLTIEQFIALMRKSELSSMRRKKFHKNLVAVCVYNWRCGIWIKIAFGDDLMLSEKPVSYSWAGEFVSHDGI